MSADPIRIELPIPPSANRLWRKGKGGVIYISAPYKAWREAAGWEMAKCRTWRRSREPIKDYSIIVHFPEKMRGDIDNRIKAINDLLKSNNVIVDDRYCRSVALFRADTTSPGRCDVALWSHDDLTPPNTIQQEPETA